jgi:hypothetical protein
MLFSIHKFVYHPCQFRFIFFTSVFNFSLSDFDSRNSFGAIPLLLASRRTAAAAGLRRRLLAFAWPVMRRTAFT